MAKSYSEKLKDPRWQKRRLDILTRDEWMCKSCHNTESTLHVHHIKYSKGEPWDIEDKYLITLCEDCHDNIEYMQKEFKDIVDEIPSRLSYDHYQEILELIRSVVGKYRDPFQLMILRKFADNPTKENHAKLLEY